MHPNTRPTTHQLYPLNFESINTQISSKQSLKCQNKDHYFNFSQFFAELQPFCEEKEQQESQCLQNDYIKCYKNVKGEEMVADLKADLMSDVFRGVDGYEMCFTCTNNREQNYSMLNLLIYLQNRYTSYKIALIYNDTLSIISSTIFPQTQQQSPIKTILGTQKGNLIILSLNLINPLKQKICKHLHLQHSMEEQSKLSNLSNQKYIHAQFLKLSVQKIQQILIICEHPLTIAALASDNFISIIQQNKLVYRLMNIYLPIESISFPKEISTTPRKKLALFYHKGCSEFLLLNINKYGVLRVWNMAELFENINNRCLQVRMQPFSQINSVFSTGILWFDFIGYFIIAITTKGILKVLALDLTSKTSQQFEILSETKLFNHQKQQISNIWMKKSVEETSLFFFKFRRSSSQCSCFLEKVVIEHKNYRIQREEAYFLKSNLGAIIQIVMDSEGRILGRNEEGKVLIIKQELTKQEEIEQTSISNEQTDFSQPTQLPRNNNSTLTPPISNKTPLLSIQISPKKEFKYSVLK